PQQRQSRDDRRRAEPRRLVTGGRDRERERGAGLVPDTAVVRRDHAEPVLAWRKIRVERLPAIASVLPIPIVAVELVAETILLRGDEGQRGVVNLQIACQRWKGDQPVGVPRRLVRCVVGGDQVDLYRRRQRVVRKVARIDDADTAWRDEP